jgi:hypothetical protein
MWLGLAACHGMSGVSDLEFGQGVGSYCSADTDCDRDIYCDLYVGRCAPQKPAGSECQEGRECETDQCADGVCCDGPCDGFCESCAVEGSEGMCVLHPEGEDPDDECPGSATCQGDGTCVAQHLWSYSFGDEEVDEGVAVAVDGDGNVIVAGQFQGSISFGADPFDANSGYDVFVAKFDPDGNHLWSQRFGGGDNQYAVALAVDGENRIVLGGHFSGTIDLDRPHDSVSYSDLYVAKLSPSGEVLWSKRFGDDGGQLLRDLDVDSAGDIAITGTFNGTINFDGTTYDRVGTGYEDVFVAKLGADGAVLWSAAYGNDHDQEGTAVALDSAGAVVVGGWTHGALAVGGPTLQNEGGTDIFVAKYDSDGAHAWSKRFGDSDYQYITDVAVDSEDRILLTGHFGGAVNFGGNQLSSTDGLDVFVAKLAPGGGHSWSQRFGDQFDQEARGIVVDGSDNIFVTGSFTLGIDLGGGYHECAGDDDVFLLKLQADGTHVWSQPFGSLLSESGRSVATDAEGNVALIGTYQHRIDLGGGALESEGSTDAFVAKFGL